MSPGGDGELVLTQEARLKTTLSKTEDNHIV
jgi:hypothetical protein